MTPLIYEKYVPPLGSFGLRLLDPVRDASLLHRWVTQPYAQYWGMQSQSRQEVYTFYRDLMAQHPQGAYLGLFRGRPAFLLERYQAIHDPVGQCYPARQDDYGMHILVAPAQEPLSGFTWAIFRTIVEFMFSDQKVARIVVEPDIRNEKIHRLNKRAGFAYQHPITLPNKTAWLAFCTREQYADALRRDMQPHTQEASL
ncbi:GNAT family N-acetyltransferase [Enterobacillus tribolii]|uniref:RimJ/RimL family protein N-acetyltransferase n=1 Tax=Enterobacillus tribolii TaxID=1487935 RepID=A0A370QQ99_9GAMM|nr:GNAT family N-acetyltransferase [Enterobacillus tribolii]MBW7981565.1 N-acetyltransferase [Enterobacillus tribolii]RDK90942.1 RimJ/RimL family protein N-acetyltransferase [Enterobacillus tribolii]